MYLDLDEVESNSHATDVCIVGAGVAGITLARRMLQLGHTVTVLESGGKDYESPIANLNAGENVGQPYYDLQDARLRFFGGTTAIWGGRIAELDAADFEPRPWVAHSGWPLRRSDLEQYYLEARKVFDIDGDWPTAADLPATGTKLPSFDRASLAVKFWIFDPRFNRFTFGACGDVLEHPRCTVYTHATVTEIQTGPEARFVTGLVVRSLSGRELQVRARAVVLATGGLENPRLLLTSRSTMRDGLGNSHDLVGRYFMEHPHARGGKVVARAPWALLKAFGRRHPLANGQIIAPLITASEAAQASARMLNGSVTIVPRQPSDAVQFWGMRAYHHAKQGIAPTRAGRALWMHTKRAANYLQRRFDPLRPWLLHKAGRLDLALLVRAEQSPNPDSRVTLTDQRDAFGLQRLKLDWRLNRLDVHSVERLVTLLRQEFRRVGLGDVVPAPWLSQPDAAWRSDPLISSHPIGGYHHMGTTRMAEDPRHGVTDPFGRVHGIENLFIAGSSLFPTSGWANPTLTIVALALRTADRLSQRLARPQAIRALAQERHTQGHERSRA